MEASQFVYRTKQLKISWFLPVFARSLQLIPKIREDVLRGGKRAGNAERGTRSAEPKRGLPAEIRRRRTQSGIGNAKWGENPQWRAWVTGGPEERGGRQESEIGGQKSEGGGQKSEVGGRKSEVRTKVVKGGSQTEKDLFRIPHFSHFVFRIPHSAFRISCSAFRIPRSAFR